MKRLPLEWEKIFANYMLVTRHSKILKSDPCPSEPHKRMDRYLNKQLLFSRSVMSNSFVIPLTVAHQTPLSMGFPKQEYWNGLSFPSPGDIPDPVIKSASPALQADSLLLVKVFKTLQEQRR